MSRVLTVLCIAAWIGLSTSSVAVSKEIWVNCNQQSLEDAISDNRLEPTLIVNLSGVCVGSYVNIGFSTPPDVTLQAKMNNGRYGARIEMPIQATGNVKLHLSGVSVDTSAAFGLQAVGAGSKATIANSSVRSTYGAVLAANHGAVIVSSSRLRAPVYGLLAILNGSATINDSTLRSDSRADTPYRGELLYGAALGLAEGSKAKVQNSRLINTYASEGPLLPRHAVHLRAQSHVTIEGGEVRGEVRLEDQSPGLFYGVNMIGRYRGQTQSIASIVGTSAHRGPVDAETGSIITIGQSVDPLSGAASCTDGGAIFGKTAGLNMTACPQ